VATNKKSKALGVAVYLINEQNIKSLYVDPKHSGQGIGSRLLKHIERFANRTEAKKLNLKASLNSIAFYKSMGFDAVKEAKQILSNGTTMDAMFIEKAIN
jgi:ribosomal protein S18 acetylase RimI-like enzyme